MNAEQQPEKQIRSAEGNSQTGRVIRSWAPLNPQEDEEELPDHVLRARLQQSAG